MDQFEHVFDALDGPIELFDEVDNDTGIQRTAARRHWNAVDGREAHGGVSTDAVIERTQACTAAQMRCHHAAARDIGRNARKLTRDELV